jgi:hypothetical protein
MTAVVNVASQHSTSSTRHKLVETKPVKVREPVLKWTARLGKVDAPQC